MKKVKIKKTAAPKGGLSAESIKVRNDFFKIFDRCVAIYRAVDGGRNFVFTYFNPAAEKTERIKKEKVLGKKVTEVFPGVKKFGLFEVFQRVWRTGKSEHFPLKIYKDNRIFGWRENYINRLPTGEIIAIYEDLSKVKKIEQELRESEEKFRTFLEHTSDIEIFRDKNLKLQYVSPAFKRITGYDPEDYLSGKIKTEDILCCGGAGKIRKIYKEILEKGKSVNDIEFGIIKKDGTKSFTSVSCTPVKGGDEKFLGIRISIRDITDRKLAEKRLEEKEKNFHSFIDNTDRLIQSVRPDGHFDFVNKAWREALGYTKKDLEKITIWDIVHPGSLRHCKKLFLRVMGGETVAGIRAAFLAKNGQRITVEGSAAPRILDGKIVATQGFFADITKKRLLERALRKSEEKFRAVFEGAADGIVAADQKTKKFVFANHRMAKSTGYSLAELLKLGVADIHPREKLPYVIGEFKKLISGEKDVSANIPVLKKNGEVYYCDVNCTKLSLRERDLAVGFFRDVTDRKKAEEVIADIARFPEENPSLVIRVSKEGRLLYTNPSAKKMAKETKLKVEIGKNIPQEMIKFVKGAYAAGKIREMDYAFGKKVYSFRLTPIKNRGYVNIYGVDITEKRRAEELLKSSEQELKNAQAFSHVGSWEWDIKTGKVKWSDEMYRLFGVKKNGLNVDLDKVVAAAIHPDDREKVFKSNLLVVNEKKTTPMDYRVIWPDKSVHVIWSEAGELILDEKNRPSLLRGFSQDITERKLAEEALNKSEEKFRTIAANLNDIIFSVDLGGVFTYISPVVEGISGYKPEEVIGKPFRNFVHPDDFLELQASFMHTVKTGIEIPSEFRIFGKDKKIIYVRTSSRPILEKGRPVGLSGIITNITDLIAARRVAEETNKKMETILKTIPAGMYMVDEDMNIVWANEGFKKIFGEKSVGKKCYEVCKDDKKQCGNCPLRKKIKVGEIGEVILSGVAGGRIFEVTHTGTELPDGKKVILAIFDDITERKRSEEALQAEKDKLQMYFDVAEIMILVTDDEQNIVFANKHCYKVLKTDSSQIIGKNLIHHLVPENKREKISYFFDAVAKGKSEYSEPAEISIFIRSGEKKIIVWRAAPLRDTRGKIRAFLCAGVDVTSLRQAENSVEELKKVDRLKDDFLNIAAHELKTPLTSIIGMSQILEKQGKGSESVEVIREEAIRLKKVVEQILSVTRYESGKILLEKEKFVLADFIGSLRPSLEILAKRNGSKIVFDFRTGNKDIFNDKSKIAEMIYNFVDNAVKYGRENQEIKIAAEPTENGFVRISVADQGPGISGEDRERLFQKFTQLQPTLSRSREGTGLGLYICKLAAEKLGGRIGVESEPGKGSTFYFTLPENNILEK